MAICVTINGVTERVSCCVAPPCQFSLNKTAINNSPSAAAFRGPIPAACGQTVGLNLNATSSPIVGNQYAWANDAGAGLAHPNFVGVPGGPWTGSATETFGVVNGAITTNGGVYYQDTFTIPEDMAVDVFGRVSNPPGAGFPSGQQIRVRNAAGVLVYQSPNTVVTTAAWTQFGGTTPVLTAADGPFTIEYVNTTTNNNDFAFSAAKVVPTGAQSYCPPAPGVCVTINGGSASKVDCSCSQSCDSTGTIPAGATGPFSAPPVCPTPVATLDLLVDCLEGSGYTVTVTDGTPCIPTAAQPVTLTGTIPANGSTTGSATGTTAAGGQFQVTETLGAGSTFTGAGVTSPWRGTTQTPGTVLRETFNIANTGPDASATWCLDVNAGVAQYNATTMQITYDTTKFEAFVQSGGSAGTPNGTIIASGVTRPAVSQAGVICFRPLTPGAINMASGSSTSIQVVQNNASAINNETHNLTGSVAVVQCPKVVNITGPNGIPNILVGTTSVPFTVDCLGGPVDPP